mgnify:FL=1
MAAREVVALWVARTGQARLLEEYRAVMWPVLEGGGDSGLRVERQEMDAMGEPAWVKVKLGQQYELVHGLVSQIQRDRRRKA